MMEVIVQVHSLLIGSESGPIHMVFLPRQVPAPLARYSCILPGVPARMQACMSAWVQPGGSFISGWALASLGESAAWDFANSARVTTAMRMDAMKALRFMRFSS